MPFDNPPEPREPSREVQLLRLARDKIGSRHRWVQGKWTTSDGRLCLVMAIQEACSAIQKRQERRRMVRRLIRHLDRETPFQRRVMLCWLSARQRVVCFNDRRSTTYRDVMGLFHNAIERLEWSEMSEAMPADRSEYPSH